MTEKLTPRVGDRVLVQTGASGGNSRTGDVRRIDEAGVLHVEVHGVHRPAEYWQYTKENVQVLDREPVEWPEGWEQYDGIRRGELVAAYHVPTNLVYTHRLPKDLLATGPEMIARWDELMGES